MDQEPPKRRGSPGDYPPDLRPALILVTLLVVIVVGWVILSPMILPAR